MKVESIHVVCTLRLRVEYQIKRVALRTYFSTEGGETLSE
jgi:hypothetical protein